ncbi:hypothetical protein IAU59_001532 [Kwoniella sp. CBS 9459]
MQPGYARCIVANCDRFAVIADDCAVCRGGYCWGHIDDGAVHKCIQGLPPDIVYPHPYVQEPEASELLKLLDFAAIQVEIESLVPGRKCVQMDTPENPRELRDRGGAFNYNLLIQFDDGSKWLMRIRRLQIKRQPFDAIYMNMLSEMATLQALSEKGVKAPSAIARPANSKLDRRLIYFYESYIDGKGLPAYAHTRAGDIPQELMTAYIRSYAKWMIRMEKVSFDQAGSLTADSNGNIVVGPHIERNRTTTLGAPYYLGPFKTAKERDLTLIDHRMQLIIDKEHNRRSNEIVAYLVLLESRELVGSCAELDRGPWYNGNTTGIIDWEWAFLVSKAQAFAAPGPIKSDRNVKYGSNAVGANEKLLITAYEDLGRPDLAELVRSGRKWHRLFQVLVLSRRDVKTLNSLHRAFAGLPEDEMDDGPKSIREWTKMRLLKFRDDPGLKVLRQRRFRPGK